MKTLFNTLLFSFITQSLLSQCPIPHIVSPNGNELYYNHSEVEITFDYGAHKAYRIFNPEYVFFYYSLDGGETWIYEDSISVDTSIIYVDPIIKYMWNIEGIVSSNCLIKIKKYEWGCWDESDEEFTINRLSSSTEKNNLLKEVVELFPNPILKGDFLNIKNQNQGRKIIGIQIYNSNGSRIDDIKIEYNNTQVSTDNLSPGTYYLIIQFRNTIEKRKIIIL